MTVDKPAGINTIPQILGARKSKVLGTISILASTLLAALLILAGVYPAFYMLPVLLYAMIAALAIWGSREERSDYYFAGLVDGVMVIGYLLVIVGSLLLAG